MHSKIDRKRFVKKYPKIAWVGPLVKQRQWQRVKFNLESNLRKFALLLPLPDYSYVKSVIIFQNETDMNCVKVWRENEIFLVMY